jgi:hypothetical protein
MAENVVQLKRTSVSGRAANTTTLTNPAELALNMTDGILYSTNGSVVFEIGANNTNVNVTANLTANTYLGSNTITVYTTNNYAFVSNTIISGSASLNPIKVSVSGNTTGNVTVIQTNLSNTGGSIGAGSYLIDLQFNGVSKFRVSPTGVLTPGSTIDMSSGHVTIQNGYNLGVYGSSGISWNNEILKYRITYTSSNTSTQVLDANPKASYRSIEYLIQATSSTSYHNSRVIIIHDGTTPFISEYGTIFTGSSLASFDASIVGANVNLTVTPTNAVTSFKILKTLMTI